LANCALEDATERKDFRSGHLSAVFLGMSHGGGCLMAVGAGVGYAFGMRVRVLYFGVLREKLGDLEFLELTDLATVASVLNVYRERVPGFAWDSIAVAVNQEYARAEVELQDGDEVALLPPVSGGIEG
jgi:molybdopterin converting factor subunit 1